MSREAMTAAEFARLADVSRETLARLEAYAALLVQWAGAVNLVGRDSLDDLWRRHMLDSAQLVRHLPATARRIVDLGSGAGFPGLVIALVAGRPVDLIEATGRKAAFLREAARVTGAPVTVHHGRIEAIAAWPADVVTARALAPLDALLAYAEPFLTRSEGENPLCLFLKGAEVERELTETGKKWTMTVERFPSVSDPRGTVLRIRGVSRG